MKFKLIWNKNSGLKNEPTIDTLNENKGQIDKQLMVDVVNNYNNITINGTDYVLHHLSGKKADKKDRVTSNMLLTPNTPTLSGDKVHTSIHKLARIYKKFESECKQLQSVTWLYIGKGNQLMPITVEEVIQRLVKG